MLCSHSRCKLKFSVENKVHHFSRFRTQEDPAAGAGENPLKAFSWGHPAEVFFWSVVLMERYAEGFLLRASLLKFSFGLLSWWNALLKVFSSGHPCWSYLLKCCPDGTLCWRFSLKVITATVKLWSFAPNLFPGGSLCWRLSPENNPVKVLSINYWLANLQLNILFWDPRWIFFLQNFFV